MRRMAWIEQHVIELSTKSDNWKEQFESLQLEKDVLAGEKETLEQQLWVTIAELAMLKASTNQAEKEKDKMEATFA